MPPCLVPKWLSLDSTWKVPPLSHGATGWGMSLGDTQDVNESKWKAPGSLMRVCRAECGENMTLTETTRMTEVCTAQGIPHRETINTMGKQDRGSSPCKRAVFSAWIQKKMKSREVAVSIVLCTCVHTGVCVRTCVHIHVHMCTLDLEQHHRECGKGF